MVTAGLGNETSEAAMPNISASAPAGGKIHSARRPHSMVFSDGVEDLESECATVAFLIDSVERDVLADDDECNAMVVLPVEQLHPCGRRP